MNLLLETVVCCSGCWMCQHSCSNPRQTSWEANAGLQTCRTWSMKAVSKWAALRRSETSSHRQAQQEMCITLDMHGDTQHEEQLMQAAHVLQGMPWLRHSASVCCFSLNLRASHTLLRHRVPILSAHTDLAGVTGSQFSVDCRQGMR